MANKSLIPDIQTLVALIEDNRLRLRVDEIRSMHRIKNYIRERKDKPLSSYQVKPRSERKISI